jgi:hypothetical protein
LFVFFFFFLPLHPKIEPWPSLMMYSSGWNENEGYVKQVGSNKKLGQTWADLSLIRRGQEEE